MVAVAWHRKAMSLQGLTPVTDNVYCLRVLPATNKTHLPTNAVISFGHRCLRIALYNPEKSWKIATRLLTHSLIHINFALQTDTETQLQPQLSVSEYDYILSAIHS